MKCSKCGRELEGRYCTNCGARAGNQLNTVIIVFAAVAFMLAAVLILMVFLSFSNIEQIATELSPFNGTYFCENDTENIVLELANDDIKMNDLEGNFEYETIEEDNYMMYAFFPNNRIDFAIKVESNYFILINLMNNETYKCSPE